MTDRRTTVTLSVTDDFSRNLQNFARQMSEAEKGVQNMGRTAQSGGSLQALNQQLFYMSQNAMLVYNTFSRVFSTADQWAQIGIGAYRSQVALEKMTGSAQEAQKWIEAIQTGARNTITSGEASAQAYQLMRFNLAATAEEAQKFIETISIVAAANPRLGDTNEAISQISLTLSNMSFMRLDQLGISAGQVRQRIQELKDETAGLSNEDAFRMAVLEQLDEQAQTLGTDFLKLGTSTEQAKARLREFKEEVGGKVAVALDTAATSAMQLYDILQMLGAGETIIRIVTQLNGPTSFNEAATSSDVGPIAGFYNAFGTGPQDLIVGNGAFGMAPTVSGLVGEGKFGSERRGNYPGWYPGAPAYDEMKQQSVVGFGPNAARAAQRGATGVGWEIEQLMGTWQRDLGQVMPGVMQEIVGLAGDLAGALSDSVSTTSDLVSGAQSAADEFERLKNMSLDETFGIDAGTFATDVYGEMTSALDAAGVSGDAAAAAIDRYQLATGMATGSSEVFANRMDTLAESLANGSISAEEYVNAVMALSTTDFSWLDTITSGLIDDGDIEKAQRYIEIVSTYSTAFGAPSVAPTGVYNMTGTEPFTPPWQQDVTTTDQARQIQIENTEALGKVVEFQSAVEAAVGAKYMLTVDMTINAPSSITIPLNVPGTAPVPGTAQSGPAASTRNIPEFHEGGYTGDSGGPFLAMLKPREVVTPADQIQSGRGGGAQTIRVDNRLYIDSREVAVANDKQKYLRNQRS